MTAHLNETALFDLLAEPAGAEAAAGRLHLAQCASCAKDFAALNQALGDFRTAVTGLASEQRLQPIVSQPARRPLLQRPRLMWAAGLAAAVLVSVSSLAWLPSHVQPAPLAGHVQAAAQPVAPAQSDDALLNDIAQDLATPLPPPLKPLAVETSTSPNTNSN